jgi:outer membrane protein assembly factor BamA
MIRRPVTVFLAVVLVSSRAYTQDPTPGADLPTDGSSPLRKADARVIAIPILRSAPATGFGGGVGFAALFPSDSGVFPSAVGIGGVYSTNNSWAYGLGGRVYAAGDLARFAGGAAGYGLRYDFFGVGNEAGDDGDELRVIQRGNAEMFEATVRVRPSLYVGPRYRRAQFTVEPDETVSFPSPTIVTSDRRYLTSALGGALLYDTRDSELWPESGTLVRGSAMFARDGFGGLQSFNDFDLAGSHYLFLSRRSVLALRLAFCNVTDGAPAWELCQFGLGPDLRGYVAGRYRDHALGAGQAEYRFPIWRRFGGVAFGGAGEIAPELGSLNFSDVLASGGVGVRYRVLSAARLNAGIDYAVGKNGGEVYFRLGEAF